MKKKALIMFWVLLLAFPLVSVESSQAATGTYVITPEIGVNLRAAPHQEGATVTKLKQGYRVELLEESGEWLKVSYEGKEGYVKSEYLKYLDIDLVAAYKHYAAVLEETMMGGHYYSLLYDFTQDGLEELYIVEQEDNGFRHRMLSGEKELFDKALPNDKHGLDIYWDDYNYYLVETLGESDRAGVLYTPDQLGITSQHEFAYVGISRETVNIIRSGNLSLSSTQTFVESGSVMDFVTDGEHFKDEDNTEFSRYIVSEKEVTKEQWDKAVAGYKNAPNNLMLLSYYGGDFLEEESNFDETLEELFALYEKYNDSPTKLLLDETKIEEIEQYTNYMLQDSIKDVDNNEIDYYALLNMALYYAMDLSELYDEEEYTYQYPKLLVDEWMYNNFGIKMDDEKLENHMLRYETEYGAGAAKSIEVQEEYYIAPGSGDIGIGDESYIINSHQLEDDFIALGYVHGYTKALSILTTEPDYIIVKQVETANGETYYPYIDTLQTLESIDYDALNNYAERLDVVKNHKQVQRAEKPVGQQTKEALMKESEKQGKTTNFILYALIAVGGLGLVVSIVVKSIQKGKNSGKINKSITIMMIVFVGMIVGSITFMSISPSQFRTGLDTSLGDETQEDNDSITVDDDEQESNDVEEEQVDFSQTEIPDINEEDIAPPVTENTNLMNSEAKSEYLVSIQYAENLLKDAGTSGNPKDNMWDAYRAWDDELNRIYGLLKEKLSPQKMEMLRTEQRAWIKERNRQADPEKIDSFEEIEILNGLVKEKTLDLIDMYFDGE